MGDIINGYKKRGERMSMALSLCLTIVLAVVTLDQLTKIIFMEVSAVLIPDLLVFVPKLNEGAAFSMLEGERVFFVIFTVISLYFMFYLLITRKWSNNTFFRITLSLMIGGVIGNFVDRVAFGAVRDFIYLPPLGFVCNIADVAISCACVMFVIYVFFIRDKEEKAVLGVKDNGKTNEGEKT